MFLPRFQITNRMIRAIAQVEVAKDVIENAPLVPYWEKKFAEEALVRTVHHTTHLEGNPLGLNEAKEVLLEGMRENSQAFQEVLNYRQVMKYIDEEARSKVQPDEGDLLKLHSLISKDILDDSQRGRYRTRIAMVRDSRTKLIIFTAPKPHEVGPQVKDFLAWLASPQAREAHPILKAGIAHYEIARIHPFSDGNGRVARALATLILFKEGYDVKKFFAPDEYYDRNSYQYYKVLQATSNQKVADESKRDLTAWLEFFCEGLAVELTRVKERIQKISLDVKLRGKIGQVHLNERQMKLVEYIQANGGVTATDWRRLIPEYSDDTILRDLRDLMKKKIVRKKGSTKAALYILR